MQLLFDKNFIERKNAWTKWKSSKDFKLCLQQKILGKFIKGRTTLSINHLNCARNFIMHIYFTTHNNNMMMVTPLPASWSFQDARVK